MYLCNFKCDQIKILIVSNLGSRVFVARNDLVVYDLYDHIIICTDHCDICYFSQPSSDEYMRTTQLEEEILKTLNSVIQGDLGCKQIT